LREQTVPKLEQGIADVPFITGFSALRIMLVNTTIIMHRLEN